MFKNSYKIIFFWTMILGTLISVSSNSWFSIWMGLEMNLLSFIPLMLTKKNIYSSEATLKYFLIQALASSMLLFSIMMFWIFLQTKFDASNIILMMIFSNLLMKSGAAPFHFWLPSVMEGLSWKSNFIILTWQKIAPLMILSYCLNSKFLIFSVIMAVIFGSLGGLNQTSLRKIMAFSSINHLGWMLAGMLYNEKLWIIYFCFYLFLSTSMIFIFENNKLFNINQTFSSFYSSFMMKISMFLVLLSMGGLPPFLGFFPKWIVIESMIKMNNFFILMIMLFFTLITLFFYLRISYSSLLINNFFMNWNYKNNFNLFNVKLNIFFCMLSMSGLMLINLIFIFI